MSENNDRAVWGSKFGFLMAAIGSAVGLGNIWRFSYVTYENGGAAFLVPYLIAILVAGIPLMILEYGFGHKERGSSPLAFSRSSKKWEWVGWWMPTVATIGIQLFYAVVMAWCVRYFMFSFTLAWGADTGSFFANDFLKISKGGPFDFVGIRWDILASTLLVWGVCWAICYREVNHGIEKACSVFMPLLFILTSVLVCWSLTLEGAMDGVRAYIIDFNWDKVTSKTWIAAFGQIFFSLSLGFGIMITYASYLPKKTNIVKSAYITTICNCAYSVFAGFAVFATLGFMLNQKTADFTTINKQITAINTKIEAIAGDKIQSKKVLAELNESITSNAPIVGILDKQQKKLLAPKQVQISELELTIKEEKAEVEKAKIAIAKNFPPFATITDIQVLKLPELDEIVAQGPSLAFVTYPETINQLPFGQKIFGVLFFFTLIIAGLSSGVSLIEAFVCSITDKFNWARGKVVTWVCVLGFFGSVIFTTNAGILILDIVDHFVNQYGLLVGGTLECVFVGWIVKAKVLQKHINSTGEGSITVIWNFLVKFVTPAILLVILGRAIYNDVTNGYGGFTITALIVYGVLFLAFTIIIAIVLAVLPWTKAPHEHTTEEEHLLI